MQQYADAVINGTNKIGGFVGSIWNTTNTMIEIKSSVNYGSVISSGRFTGGFVGLYYNNTKGKLKISDSENKGPVQGGEKDNIGGFIGYADNSTETTITNSVNHATIEGGFDVGGFIGFGFNRMRETIKIENCKNYGDIIAKNGAAGGIVGTLSSFSNVIVSHCYVNGTISTKEQSNYAIGGLIGRVQNEPNFYSNNNDSQLILEHNECEIHVNQKTSIVGGIIGKINGTLKLTIKIIGTNTNGTINTSLDSANSSFVGVGGFIGLVVNNSALHIEFTDSTSNCLINATNVSKVGGLIGSVINNKNIINGIKIKFTNTKSNGTITCAQCSNVGGFIGFLFNIKTVEIVEECQNNGTININKTEDCAVGGFIGLFTNDMNVVIHPVVEFKKTSINGNIIVKESKTSTVGGFIGGIHENDGYLNDYSVFFNDCKSNGEEINVNAQNDIHLGGFIGNMTKNGYFHVEMNNCSNKCINMRAYSVSDCYVGGFIGWVGRNGFSNLTLFNCESSATLIVTGVHNDVGGFVGSASRNHLMNVTLTNVTNTAPIYVETNSMKTDVGGIVGGVEENPAMTLTMNNVTNNANVTTSKWYYEHSENNESSSSECGKSSQSSEQSESEDNSESTGSYESSQSGSSGSEECSQNSENNENENMECGANNGGLVGRLELVNDATDFELFISNGVNKGNITNNCAASLSCGLLCVSSESFLYYRTVSVNNSINKGVIYGNVSYGIATKVTHAENVVCMGNVIGNSSNPSFDVFKNFDVFENTIDFAQTYVLDSLNNITKGHTVFSYKNDKYITNGKQVDELLNKQAMDKQYGLIWSKDLDMIRGINITVEHPDNKIYVVVNGTNASTFKALECMKNASEKIKHLVDVDNNSKEILDSIIFNHDIKVKLCHQVCFEHDFKNCTFVNDGALLNESLPEKLNQHDLTIKKDSKDYMHERIISDINLTVIVHCHRLDNESSCKNFSNACMWIGTCQKKSVAAFIISIIVFQLLGVFVPIIVLIVWKKTHRVYIEIHDIDDDKIPDGFTHLHIGNPVTLQTIEKLGDGPFGTVFKAQAEGTGTPYAMKVIPTINTWEVTEIEKRAREMEEKQNPQLMVAIYGYGYTDKSIAIISEYFDTSLQDVLLSGDLPVNCQIPMLLDIAKAMSYLHSQNIVHGHLKPGNVFVCSLDPTKHPMCKFVFFLSLTAQNIEKKNKGFTFKNTLNTESQTLEKHGHSAL